MPDVPGTFITFGRQGTESRALDASWTNPVTTEPAVAQLLAAGGLRRYLEEVAAALGVPADAVDYEVSNTATSYLALTARHPAHPGRDLMLSWQDTDGWSLATEPTAPTEAAIPIAHLAGNVLPAPEAVARFTDHALTNQHTSSRR